MARYIDADKVMEEINRIGGHNLCEWETIGVKALIDRQPTADVVPKSEVDKWYHEYHVIKDALKQEKMYQRGTEKLADKYYTELQTAKSEVAREVIEFIENEIKAMEDHTPTDELDKAIGLVSWILLGVVDQLKRKYTEEKE